MTKKPSGPPVTRVTAPLTGAAGLQHYLDHPKHRYGDNKYLNRKFQLELREKFGDGEFTFQEACELYISTRGDKSYFEMNVGNSLGAAVIQGKLRRLTRGLYTFKGARKEL